MKFHIHQQMGEWLVRILSPASNDLIVFDATNRVFKNVARATWLTAAAIAHAMTSAAHTAGNWKVFYSNGSGTVTEVALGAAKTVLVSGGAAAAPSFPSTLGVDEANTRVGVGTLVPSYTLTVGTPETDLWGTGVGAAIFNAGDAAVVLRDTTNNIETVLVSTADVGGGFGAGLLLYTLTSHQLMFGAGGTPYLSLSTAGALDHRGSFQCDSIVNDTGLAAGTFTPTRSAEANITGTVTLAEGQYMRVGNTVTFSGRVTIDPVLTATATSFEMDLPVASNLGAAEDLAGVGFCGAIAGMGAEIIGVAANNTAKFQFISSDITSQVWSFQFTYAVI